MKCVIALRLTECRLVCGLVVGQAETGHHPEPLIDRTARLSHGAEYARAARVISLAESDRPARSA